MHRLCQDNLGEYPEYANETMCEGVDKNAYDGNVRNRYRDIAFFIAAPIILFWFLAYALLAMFYLIQRVSAWIAAGKHDTE